MSTITVPMKDEDLDFLRAWSKEHGTSAEALIAEQVRALRERLEKPLHPDVAAAIGILLPGADEEAYRRHLEQKYL